MINKVSQSVQSLSSVWLFVTLWIAARQASLSITNSRSSLRLTSIESVMPSSHLILCQPLLLLPPIPPSIRVFSNESTLRMRWPKDWSFSFSIIPSKESYNWHGNNSGYVLGRASLVAQMVKNPLQCGRLGSLDWEDSLEEGWQPTPVFLPGESPWTEEPGRLQSMALQRFRHDWMTFTFTCPWESSK